jgi:hypothetical protein
MASWMNVECTLAGCHNSCCTIKAVANAEGLTGQTAC